jgi:hypothetical protein
MAYKPQRTSHDLYQTLICFGISLRRRNMKEFDTGHDVYFTICVALRFIE